MGLFGGPIFWTLERDFFPRQSASQAMGFWRWLNYANEDATNPLLLNMDETSVALRPRAEHGTVATRLKKPGSRAIDAASLQEMRTRFTLMCTICGDTRIQPFLPQVLLTNGRVFGRKPTIPHLKGNLVMWTQQSAWASQGTLRRYLSLLGRRLQDVAPGRDYLLLLDCVPCHVHESIKRQATLSHIRLLYVAAGLTRLLQPADVAVFGQLKQKFAELYQAKKADNTAGKVLPLEWLHVLGSAVQAILPAVKWSHAFGKVGALNHQTDVPASVYAELGWCSPPKIPDGPPTEMEARAVFPKGRNLNVMAYVMWKKFEAPIRLHKGKRIRTID